MRMAGPKSFRGKLFILVALATSTAVAVAGGAAWTVEAMQMKPHALAELSTDAEVIAMNSAAALAFDDRDAERETLECAAGRAECYVRTD